MIKDIQIQDNQLKIEIQQTETTSVVSYLPIADGTKLLNKLKSLLLQNNERFISLNGLKTKEEIKSCFPEDYDRLVEIFETKD